MRRFAMAIVSLALANPVVAQIPKLGADTGAKVTAEEFAQARQEVARGTFLRGLWRSVKIVRAASPVTGVARTEADRMIDEADRLATAGDPARPTRCCSAVSASSPRSR